MRLAALLFAATAPACFVADVGDAFIACDDAADCPEPLFCDGGRCRRGSAADTTPPGVVAGSAVIAAGTLRPGVSTTLSFQATEALAETPRLAGDDLTFGDVVEDAGTFVVPVTVAAAADDGSRNLEVVLVDVAGNESEPVFLGAIAVDGTPPALVSAQVPAIVSAGQALVVSGTASEPLASMRCTFDPTVGDDAAVDGDVDGPDFDCVGPAFGIATGAVLAAAVLTDVAGNSSAVLALGAVAVR